MSEIFFENFHNAFRDYPYFDGNMRNINYISHYHEEIEIIFVIKGEVNIICEKESYIAKKDDICILMPGEIHSFISHKSNHLYILKLNVKNSVEKTDFYSLFIESRIINCNTQTGKILKNSIDGIAHETKNKKPGYAYSANSYQNRLICDILRLCNIRKSDAVIRKKHLSALNLIEKVNSYIENHYTEQISLEEISAFCNYSQYYFSHFFKEVTGITFYNYLTAYRLEKAANLIDNSNEKITSIAYSCGFSNVRSFNRAFKKFFNTTPGEYAKR